MNIEQEILILKSRLDNLQASFIQAQQNSVEVTAKADVGYNKPDAPYTATQTAYYGESEKVFYNVPQGNITVFWDNRLFYSILLSKFRSFLSISPDLSMSATSFCFAVGVCTP